MKKSYIILIILILGTTAISGCTTPTNNDTPNEKYNKIAVENTTIYANATCPECGGNSQIKTETENLWGSTCMDCGNQFMWKKQNSRL